MGHDFERKVAFITGAAHGQGRATALALAGEGARVVAYDIAKQIPHPGYALGSSEDLQSLEREVNARGSQALVFASDVRDDSAITKAVNDTIAHFGRIDILFNNAGICFFGKSHQLTEELWEDMLDFNLNGAWL